VARVILDSGAVIAWAARSSRVRAFLERALQQDDLLLVPAIVVAEVVRGTARDAPVNRVLNTVKEILPVDAGTARQAGGLLGASRSAATVDAVVVACALLNRPSVVVTGDPTDLRLLLGAHQGVVIQDINEV
jgi:predicted nucleic acid-binding protein